MGKQKRVLVLTDHMPWGHRAIARAIYGYLKKREKEGGIRVDYVEVDPKLGLLNDVYTFVYRVMPATNRVGHRLMRRKRLRKIFEESTVIDLAGLKKVVRRYKPDLIISCYFFHSVCLSKWKREEPERANFELWTVVADPWSVNPVSYMAGAEMHLIYDEVGVREGIKLGIPKERMLVTGWWTREEMYDKRYKRDEIRRKLGFDDDRPVIFVGGGSLGTNSIVKILPALMMVKKKVGVIFNSGTDKLMFNLVAEYGRLFARLGKNKLVQIKNLGWIDNMGEVLAACDMVFGKAGPNFLFDVVAAEKPFVAITHIGGQEDGNIELIRKKKLGWVKEKNMGISEFLLAYVENPRKYQEKFRQSIKAEAGRNRGAMELIYKKILPKGELR